MLLMLFFFGSLSCIAQSNISISQLKTNINLATNSQKKLSALLDFCGGWESYSPDTLKKYAIATEQLAVSLNDNRAIIQSDYYQAIYFFQVNKLDSGLIKINAVLKDYKKAFPYDEMYVKIYALRGNILLRTDRMHELMSQDFEWIKLSEQHKDTLGIARGQIGIGNVNLKLKKYEEALVWYHTALSLMRNPVYKRKLSFIYNNISIIFYHLAKEDSAIYYVKEGIRYSKEDQNLTNTANALYLYGGELAEFHHLNEAEENFKAAIEVRKKVGDVYYLITDMAQLALFYADNKNPDKGIQICREALMLGEKNSLDYNSLNSIYESLAKNYLVANSYKDYGEILVKQMSLKDSFYKKNSAELMAEIQAKYYVQKKENTIIAQKLQLVSKNYQLYGSLLLLLLAFFSGYIIFMQYRKKQKLKFKFMHEDEKRLASEAVLIAEENERKRIAADLHDNMGAYAAAIIANVDELSRSKNFHESTLLNLKSNAKEIVNNLRDTIWASNKQNISLTGISDRFKDYLQKVSPAYPSIKIELEENILVNHFLSSIQALNLYRILQEAVTNSFKHSSCNNIKIKFFSNESLYISITDDGKGINLAEDDNRGNGITNMKIRSSDARMNLAITSIKNEGTKIEITPDAVLQI
ncbi:MAG: ATP-binding protein [Ginsengibacter sp.]